MTGRAVLLLLACAAPAAAQDIQPHPRFAAPYVLGQLNEAYVSELRSLRAQGRRLKAADGGTLTDEHRQLIQAKLDHTNQLHRWQVTDAEQYNVDTEGHSLGR